MIEIKINGIQAEGRFDCADGEILSDDIRRVLIALYRVVCEAANDETADKAMQYIMALIGSGVIKKDYEQMMQIAGAENGNRDPARHLPPSARHLQNRRGDG